jgi:hypothetical protein
MCKQNEKDLLIFFASPLIDITRRLTTLNRYFFECVLRLPLRPLLDLKTRPHHDPLRSPLKKRGFKGPVSTI